jgi:fanconi anemia group J protein
MCVRNSKLLLRTSRCICPAPLARAAMDRARKAQGTKLVVGGVPVSFPFSAYRSQFAMMYNVVKVAAEGKHALIESPTGTGKSIALLCAALAYQQHVSLDIAAEERALLEATKIGVVDVNNHAPAVLDASAALDAFKTRAAREKALLHPGFNLNVKRAVKPDVGSTTSASARTHSSAPMMSSAPASAPDSASALVSEAEADSFRDSPSLTTKEATAASEEGDNDFAKPKRFRDATWQHNIGVRKPSACASAKGAKSVEQPENAHLPSQFDDLSKMSTGDEPEDVFDENGEPVRSRRRAPRIFYASRTHAQLTQVVGELRKSCYRPRMTILASRNEYCQHPMVRQLSGKDDKCKSFVKDSRCPLYHRAANVASEVRRGDGEPFDIEDLNKIGNEHMGCTYYASGELYKSAELILCPYNYLIDPIVREARSIYVKGDIVILDEAHNIEDHAREAGSFDSELPEIHKGMEELVEMLTAHRLGPPTGDVAVAHGQIVELLKSVARMGDSILESGKMVPDGDTEVATFQRDDLMAWMTGCGITIERLGGYKKALVTILESKDEDYEKIPNRGSSEIGAATRHQDWSQPDDDYGNDDNYDAGTQFKRRKRAHQGNARNLRAGAGYGGTLDDDEYPGSHRRQSSGSGRPFSSGVSIAGKLVCSLNFCLANPDSFVLAVQRTSSQWLSSTELHLWCLNPAIPFAALSKHARTVIVTSGTLSPIDSFAGELGVNFAVAKSLPHVVNVKTQVFASVVAFGPGAAKMDATYKGSMQFTFQDSLGQAVLDYCKVIPGGVLIFFPSYRMLKTLAERWRSTGAWAALEQIKGVVVCETNSRGEEFDEAMSSYSAGAMSDEGAVMLGVCRGKISEGMDFKDAAARGVLIVGIPYPNARAPQLLRKKEWNDFERLHSNRAELLTGSAWYDMQAFRALNQAIGRCVRHRRDYGAIILLDARFRSPYVIRQMSGWVQGAMRAGDSTHNTTMKGLTDFFANVEVHVPPE